MRKYGHELKFACSGKFATLAEEAGFAVSPIYTKDPNLGLNKARKIGSSYDDLLVQKYVESEISCITESYPDLIIGDFRLTLSISAEFCKVPYASILNGYWTNYYTASHTAPESLRIFSLLGPRISDISFKLIRSLFLKWAAKPFNKERARRGLKPCKNLFDVMASKELNLIVDIPEYTPLRNAPPNYNFVGPIIWEPNLEPPEWLKTLDAKKPVIYFTIGSTGFDNLLEEAISIYSDTDYQVIMTTGGAKVPHRIPSNFFVEQYAPGLKLMQVSDVVVCHGGNGTIYQALSRGVPIIGIPTMHDQWFNMERVEALGVGIRLSERNLQPDHVFDAVAKILSDRSFARNAQKLQKVIEKYDAPKRAAELINNFFSGKTINLK